MYAILMQTFIVLVWNLYDTCLVLVWYLSGTCLVPSWYLSSIDIRGWRGEQLVRNTGACLLSGTWLVLVSYFFGTCLLLVSYRSWFLDTYPYPDTHRPTSRKEGQLVTNLNSFHLSSQLVIGPPKTGPKSPAISQVSWSSGPP